MKLRPAKSIKSIKFKFFTDEIPFRALTLQRFVKGVVFLDDYDFLASYYGLYKASKVAGLPERENGVYCIRGRGVRYYYYFIQGEWYYCDSTRVVSFFDETRQPLTTREYTMLHNLAALKPGGWLSPKAKALLYDENKRRSSLKTRLAVFSIKKKLRKK